MTEEAQLKEIELWDVTSKIETLESERTDLMKNMQSTIHDNQVLEVKLKKNDLMKEIIQN